MQTWEYCPEYAIRTYAFILPFLPITSLWNYLRMDKITLFYAIKNILGLFFAISCRSFLRSIRKIFGSHIEGLTFLLLLTSPGIFFSSTSYLPSAVCSSLIMFSFACWLQDNFKSSIFFGCVAVLWSGWPFVGVIFLPIGLEMLYSTYSKHIMKPFMTRINAVLQFIISGLFLVFVTGFGALAIDSYMYGKL